MVRTGDIDNLGFGWPANFNPFSGANTPLHNYPWAVSETDPAGTDRIMVVTSYTNFAPAGFDGYTSTTTRPENNVQPVTLTFPADSLPPVQQALLQMFLDDFQAPLLKTSYQVHLDGIRVPEYETIINNLLQTGPIGKIVNVDIPTELLYLLNDGELVVLFDDFTTGAGDGFAIDFVKLVVNHNAPVQIGTVAGTVTASGSGTPLADVRVVANGIAETFTAADGTYQIENVPTGLVNIQTSKPGYGSVSKSVALATGEVLTVNFTLESPAPMITDITPADSSEMVEMGGAVTVTFDTAMDVNTLNAAAFVLSDTLGSIAGTFTTTDSSFTFTPDAPLAADMLHRATITTTARDINGIAIEKDSSWVFTTGTFSRVGIERFETPSYPSSIHLSPGYPNPFTSWATIDYRLDQPGQVTLEVFNVLGQRERVLVDSYRDAGVYNITWNGADESGLKSSNGLYILRLSMDGQIQTQKIMYVR